MECKFLLSEKRKGLRGCCEMKLLPGGTRVLLHGSRSSEAHRAEVSVSSASTHNPKERVLVIIAKGSN